jgi:hypothetical protein
VYLVWHVLVWYVDERAWLKLLAMAYIHNLCYSLNVVREQISCINTCKSWIMLVDFIVVVLEEKVNCVVHLFVLNFSSSSCVHCVLSWLKMLVVMWKRLKLQWRIVIVEWTIIVCFQLSILNWFQVEEVVVGTLNFIH